MRVAAPSSRPNSTAYWLDEQTGGTVGRLAAYREAGADGVFVPGLGEPEIVAHLVAEIGLPLNVLYRPGGPSVAELGRLGARRVSLGSLLYRSALGAALETVSAVRRGLPAGLGVPTYAEVQRLSAVAGEQDS